MMGFLVQTAELLGLFSCILEGYLAGWDNNLKAGWLSCPCSLQCALLLFFFVS